MRLRVAIVAYRIPVSDYDTIEFHPWASELIAVCEEAGKLRICTAGDPMRARWLKRGTGYRKCYFVDDKHELAKPGRLLIDDADHHVEDFRDHGGEAILFPSIHNARHAEAGPEAYKTVMQEIEAWSKR